MTTQFTFANISFQSPQWGKCSKDFSMKIIEGLIMFQSPQWGKCSKDGAKEAYSEMVSFSPRNGESVLKRYPLLLNGTEGPVSVPAMGKVF